MDHNNNQGDVTFSNGDVKSDCMELYDLDADSKRRSKTDDGSSISTCSSDHPMDRMQDAFVQFFVEYSTIMCRILGVTLLLTYTIYLGFAISHSVSMAMAFIVITAFVIVCLVYSSIRDRYGEQISEKCLQPMAYTWEKCFNVTKWFLFPALMIALVLYLIFDVLQESRQLQSLLGIVVFLVWTYLASKHPDKIIWRPVAWGLSLQFIFGALMLRWSPGYDALVWCADVIVTFVNYGLDGAAYVFGDPFLVLHPFAFMAMPLIVYVGMLMSMLYYYGVTQVVVSKVCWCLVVTMGTTTVESLGVVANVFLNGIDNMLMMRVYLSRLTKSEFHCFLVGGHAILAAFAFAIFVLFGVPPHHLLAAAMMSAPAAVAVAKLNYPETEQTRDHDLDRILWEKSDDKSAFRALTRGADMAGKAVAVLCSNYITFVALLTWLDSVLDYLGTRVGFEHLDFEFICSYVFWPIAWLMGVSYDHCREVAGLIGVKVFCSEILAFRKLGDFVKRSTLDVRSEVIATYALCGFSSMPSLCIALGVWNAVCPSRITRMSNHLKRAIINANICCFLTASVAGLLFTPDAERPGPNPIQRLIQTFSDNFFGYEDLLEIGAW